MLEPAVAKWPAWAAMWPRSPTRVTPRVASRVAWVPPPRSRRVASPVGVVSMYKSPAKASLPQMALCGPLTSPTRRAPAKRRWAKSTAPPVAGLLSSMPSSITSRWFASAPRTRACARPPTLPERAMARPGSPRRASSARRIGCKSSSVSTVACSSVPPSRLAWTTTVSNSAPAADRQAAATHTAGKRSRIGMASPKEPSGPGRHVDGGSGSVSGLGRRFAGLRLPIAQTTVAPRQARARAPSVGAARPDITVAGSAPDSHRLPKAATVAATRCDLGRVSIARVVRRGADAEHVQARPESRAGDSARARGEGRRSRNRRSSAKG